MRRRLGGNLFEGYYYKHQKGENVIAFIKGRCNQGEFLQIIANDRVYQFDGEQNCSFSSKGMHVNIKTNELELFGEIQYLDLTPIRYDIMGPFKFLPMECRHEVVSMHHKLSGRLLMNGCVMEFTGGKGYIEGDKGRSFPKSYMWLHSNDFPGKTSVMASVADIPMGSGSFRGCICVICHGGREYRMATYLRVKIMECSRNRLVLSQNGYLLEVEIENASGHKLRAPANGGMTRTIYESPACEARFRLSREGNQIFDLHSGSTGFEYV